MLRGNAWIIPEIAFIRELDVPISDQKKAVYSPVIRHDLNITSTYKNILSSFPPSLRWILQCRWQYLLPTSATNRFSIRQGPRGLEGVWSVLFRTNSYLYYPSPGSHGPARKKCQSSKRAQKSHRHCKQPVVRMPLSGMHWAQYQQRST